MFLTTCCFGERGWQSNIRHNIRLYFLFRILLKYWTIPYFRNLPAKFVYQIKNFIQQQLFQSRGVDIFFKKMLVRLCSKLRNYELWIVTPSQVSTGSFYQMFMFIFLVIQAAMFISYVTEVPTPYFNTCDWSVAYHPVLSLVKMEPEPHLVMFP